MYGTFLDAAFAINSCRVSPKKTNIQRLGGKKQLNEHKLKGSGIWDGSCVR